MKSSEDIPKRYYLLLSEYYLENPEKALEILTSALPLWNNMHFQMIFPLLFHQWVTNLSLTFKATMLLTYYSFYYSYFIIVIMIRSLALKDLRYLLRERINYFGLTSKMVQQDF